MKYILWPFMAIFVMFWLLIQGALKWLFILLWHFRLASAREVYTIDNEYVFEDWSWKQIIRDVFVCPNRKEIEEQED